jgi:hypothetical protein
MHPSWIGKGTTVAQRLTRSQPDRARRDGVRPGLLDASPILSEGNARLEFFGDSILKVALSETVIRESGFGPGGGGGGGSKSATCPCGGQCLRITNYLGSLRSKSGGSLGARILKSPIYVAYVSHICRICVTQMSYNELSPVQ